MFLLCEETVNDYSVKMLNLQKIFLFKNIYSDYLGS